MKNKVRPFKPVLEEFKERPKSKPNECKGLFPSEVAKPPVKKVVVPTPLVKFCVP